MPNQKVLCVCLGNSDRSPLMAAVLEMYLRNAGREDVQVESAGILEFTKNGGSASPCGVTSGKRIGLDLTKHNKRWVGQLDLSQYCLFVCADILSTDQMFARGASEKELFNAQINNPWPSSFQGDHDVIAEDIMAKMYRVVARYFSEK